MYSVKALRIALFFTSLNFADKLEIANSLTKSLSVLDGNPLIIPIPDDAPADIPRIILKSKNEDYSVNIAPQRVDFFYNEKGSEPKTYKTFSMEMLETIRILENVLRQNFAANVNRIGLMVDVGLEQGDAIKYILKYFSKTFIHKKGLQEVQIHTLNNETINGFNVNNWIRIFAQERDENRTKVLIRNDINTLVDDKKTYTDKEINGFFSSALEAVTENIKNYG